MPPQVFSIFHRTALSIIASAPVINWRVIRASSVFTFRHPAPLNNRRCLLPCTNLLYGAMLELLPTVPTIRLTSFLTLNDQDRLRVPVRLYPDFLRRCGGYLAMKRFPSATVFRMSRCRSRDIAIPSMFLIGNPTGTTINRGPAMTNLRLHWSHYPMDSWKSLGSGNQVM